MAQIRHVISWSEKRDVIDIFLFDIVESHEVKSSIQWCEIYECWALEVPSNCFCMLGNVAPSYKMGNKVLPLGL